MIEHLTLENFKEKIMDYEANKDDWKFEGKLPTILDFSADSWCQPCKILSPILEELSTEYEGKIDFYKIDVDEQQELSGMFGIRSVPSILFIPMIGEPQMVVGVLPKDKIIQAIEEIFFGSKEKSEN
jgi:thioredoxin 1